MCTQDLGQVNPLKAVGAGTGNVARGNLEP